MHTKKSRILRALGVSSAVIGAAVHIIPGPWAAVGIALSELLHAIAATDAPAPK